MTSFEIRSRKNEVYLPRGSGTLQLPADTDAPSASTSASATTAGETVSVATLPLHEKVLGDVLVGAGVTFGVAPFLTIIDKAIVQRAAGTSTLMGSMAATAASMAKNPAAFLKSPTFGLMWAVYAATYATANSLKTAVEHYEHAEKQKSKQQPKASPAVSKFGPWAIFAGTTIVNSATCMWKDRAYARMFGSTVTQAVPVATYAMWMSRDVAVIGSSFVLPDIMTKHIREAYPHLDAADVQKVAQITLPMATQFVAGPLHLLGLDMYNNPNAVGWRSRWNTLCQGAPTMIAARIARIAPLYGVGGVLNTEYRNMWRENLLAMKHSRTSTSMVLVQA